ncbi:MAG: pyruvate formate lyase family protein, partial [Oscillospiraceae bacterium]
MVNRLSKITNDMAKESLLGKWGRALVPTPLVLTEEEDNEPHDHLRHAYCVKHIAKEGPIRIVPNEKIVGASTLMESPDHVTPVRRPNGDIAMGSLSHCTPGFYFVLETGLKGLREQVAERRQHGGLDEDQLKFLQSLDITLDAMNIWHSRYMELLEKLVSESNEAEQAHYMQIAESLRNVPENPPKNFREAIQSLWFMFAFQRQCGNWPGIGRIDVMLGKYLDADLNSGAITIDDARELLAHFWIKGCEWIGQSRIFEGSGDGQHYQNIILGGVDKDGNDIVNEVTYLVLDVVEELLISDFPIAVRVSKRTPE